MPNGSADCWADLSKAGSWAILAHMGFDDAARKAHIGLQQGYLNDADSPVTSQARCVDRLISALPACLVSRGRVSSSRLLLSALMAGRRCQLRVNARCSNACPSHSARQTARLVRDCMQHCRFTIGPAILFLLPLFAGAGVVGHTRAIGRD